MTYLSPPPLPAPVIVMKDVGGYVSVYQARTEEYRASNREVRLHECRSACTLALSLPNVCVYPDSILKFHLAYNIRNHVSDDAISAEMFNSYPDAIRARLGHLTRDYKVLSGAELIALGIRDCNEPRIMVASVGKTVQRPLDQSMSLTSMVHGWMGSLTGVGSPPSQPGTPLRVASHETGKSAPSEVVFADFPLPPARPSTIGATRESEDKAQQPSDGVTSGVPLPPERPVSLSLAYTKRLPVAARLRLIEGAVPILQSKTFVSLAAIQH